MSSSLSVADLIQTDQQNRIAVDIDLAIFATVVYDWSLTFGEEFRLMWKRPITGPKILFFLNRYLFITVYVVQIIWDSHIVISNRSCLGLGITNIVFSIAHSLVTSVFQVLRVYAISSQSRKLALLVGVILIYPNVVALYQCVTTVIFVLPPQGPVTAACEDYFTIPTDVWSTLIITSRVCFVAADVITVIVTVYYMYATVKASHEVKIQAKFSSKILEAGIIYFGVMLAMNVIELIVQIRTDNNYFQNVPALFECVLISRFLLELREIPNTVANDAELSRPSFVRSMPGQVSSIRFADRVIGNLGESLCERPHEDDEDDEYDEDVDVDVDVDVDEDSTALPSDLEAGSSPHKSASKPAHTSLPSSSDEMLEVGVAGPSRLAANVVHNRTTTGLTNSEAAVSNAVISIQ